MTMVGSASEGEVDGVENNYRKREKKKVYGFILCLLRFGFSSTADRACWAQGERRIHCIGCVVKSSPLFRGHQGQGGCPALLELLSAGQWRCCRDSTEPRVVPVIV